MENTGFKSKLQIIENIAYKALTLIFSAFIGFLISRSGIKSVFSPFSLSLLSIAPASGLSTVAVYIGSFLGFITKEFSPFNFKYICANTVMLTIILISGSKQYIKNVYSPVLPGVVCLTSGFVFLFADEFSVYGLLLLFCESVLCSCTAFFCKYFFDAVKTNVMLETRDIISLDITLIILICAIDSYYIFGISMSLVFTLLIIYLTSFYLERKTACVFILPLCLTLALMHRTYDSYMLILYVPALLSVLISKFDKRYVVAAYYIPYLTLVTLSQTLSFNLSLMSAPLISAVFYYIIPKEKLGKFLSTYIRIYEPAPAGGDKSTDELCDRFKENADTLFNKINSYEITPVFNNGLKLKLKKYLFLLKCRDIDINNYYASNGKQVLSVSFKSENEVSVKEIKSRLENLTGKCYTVICNRDGSSTSMRFEPSDRYKVECFALYKAKNGENICGDNVSAFKSSDSLYSLILADGMGSGKDAYAKSHDTVSVLKKLLRSGINPEKAIGAVNTSMEMIKDGIGFSTVDLCTISLETAMAEFLKCGAYMSFIIRNSELIRINGGGFPAGLSDSVQYSKRTIQLEDYDTVVMLSDGVSFAVDRLQAVMLLNSESSLETLTKELIDSAFMNTDINSDDDMTVLTARIMKRLPE